MRGGGVRDFFGNGTATHAGVALGSFRFGSEIDRKATRDVLDAYRAAGGSIVDTAHSYAQVIPAGDGASESVIGEWMENRKCRKDVFLLTKGGHPRLGKDVCARLVQEELEADLRESLTRLRTPFVDAFLIHFDCPSRPVHELWAILTSFQREGLAKRVGVANWSASRLHELVALAGSEPLLQSCSYSFYKPPPREIITFHTKHNVPLLAYGLVAKVRKLDLASFRNVCLHLIARKLSVTTYELSMAWVRGRHTFPVIPIIGTSKVAHTRTAVSNAIGLEIPRSDREFLEQVQKCKSNGSACALVLRHAVLFATFFFPLLISHYATSLGKSLPFSARDWVHSMCRSILIVKRDFVAIPALHQINSALGRRVIPAFFRIRSASALRWARRFCNMAVPVDSRVAEVSKILRARGCHETRFDSLGIEALYDRVRKLAADGIVAASVAKGCDANDVKLGWFVDKTLFEPLGKLAEAYLGSSATLTNASFSRIGGSDKEPSQILLSNPRYETSEVCSLRVLIFLSDTGGTSPVLRAYPCTHLHGRRFHNARKIRSKPAGVYRMVDESSMRRLFKDHVDASGREGSVFAFDPGMLHAAASASPAGRREDKWMFSLTYVENM